jgi:uroporphyrin-III C-methyltransferase
MSGKAYLVGAGPGRADLITVRGLQLIRQAEVIIYDRLIAPELLDEASPDAELIFVGKESGHHIKPQDEINGLLLDRVKAGKQVVRLKGGDPFVFGRGGEEALALAEHGLHFEIVPGVTSSIAVPAFAGVPVTHRGISTAFAVVTGHESPNKAESGIDWDCLAHVPTLVIMMGVTRIKAICEAVIGAGRDAETPAIAIHQGTTDRQCYVRATLRTLPDAMVNSGLTPPAVIVIGEVAALSDRLAWFEPCGDASGFKTLQGE